jgi:TP901-1 family phage major tail protein
MNMAINGSAVLLIVNGVEVAAQTGLSIEESNEMIEASHKQSTYASYLYGRTEGSLSLEALYVPTDAGFQALKNAFKNKEVVTVRISENGTAVEEADALIESMSREYPDNDVATISVELKLNEAFTTL